MLIFSLETEQTGLEIIIRVLQGEHILSTRKDCHHTKFFHVLTYSKLLDPSSTGEVQAEAILKVVKQLELGPTVVAFIFYTTGSN